MRTDRNLFESDGPDKLKDTYACLWHHSGVGVRSFDPSLGISTSSNHVPITDYNCCCNPCLYRKPEMAIMAGLPSGEEQAAVPGHCCKCNPEVIVAQYTPDNIGDECSPRKEVEPLFLQFVRDSEYTDYHYAKYEGTLVGRTARVYLSNFPVAYDGTVDTSAQSQCQWSMYITDSGGSASAGVTGIIDHTGVTCLGVPNFSHTGVVVYEGSGGTISLSNYEAYKVPFSRRADDTGIFTPAPIHRIESELKPSIGYQDYSPAMSGLAVTLPSGRLTPPYLMAYSGGSYIWTQQPTGLVYDDVRCTTVPRYLCVKDWDEGYGIFFKRWREYIFDTGFYPIHVAEFHPSYTGVEYITTGTRLAKWEYTPLGIDSDNQLPSTERRQSIYLYETWLDEIARFNGNMEQVRASGTPRHVFQTDFELPTGVAYYHHPYIHGDDGTTLGTLIDEGERFYWTPSGASLPGQNRTLFTNDCSCDMVSSANTYDNKAGTIDYFLSISSNRCSCWQYYCSDACRCVPNGYCYYLFYNESGGSPSYTTGSMNWNPSTKCWEDTINGSGISICLEENRGDGFVRGIAGETYTGYCQVRLGGEYIDDIGPDSSAMTQGPITCASVNSSRNFSGGSEDGVRNFLLAAHPVFAECNRLKCDEASPCGGTCGSHPESLTMEVSGYSVYDEDECYPRVEGGIDCTQACSASINLEYFQEVTYVAGDPASIEIECGYKGIGPCGAVYTWKDNGTEGVLTIDADYYTFTFGNTDSPRTEYISYACDPYEVNLEIQTNAPDVFWFDDCPNNNCTIHRMDITITEN